MLITRTSSYSGKTRTKDLPVTEAQMNAWQRGEHIQKALSHLSADEREFILTGITPEEWAEIFMGDPEIEES